MWLLTASDIQAFVNIIGLDNLIDMTIDRLQLDYSRWNNFYKCSRHAVHHKLGVLELMPCADDLMYSFKYVNGHPINTSLGKLCVAAFGMLAQQTDGYPKLLCDMTWLTAIRTAATTALVAKIAAPSNFNGNIGLIGVGAQSEFMLTAIARVLPIKTCYYYDIDSLAMKKFANNMHNKFELVGLSDLQLLASKVDVLVTLTAAKHSVKLIDFSWLKPGALVCGIGGDTPGKTELSLLENNVDKIKIIIEYFDQTKVEGELQNIRDYFNVINLADLIINSQLVVRDYAEQIVLFDSVGFALEDFSILMVLYNWLQTSDKFKEIDFLPNIDNPKDLYGALFKG